MPLATGYILQDAYKRHYAVPAFSVHTFDMVDAVLAQAEQDAMPVLLMVGQRAIRNRQMQTLVDYICDAAPSFTIPIGIHLDHCRDNNQVIQAIRAGMTSFMMDASAHPFDVNVARTRAAVEACHAVDMPVEGELGAIGGVEDDISVRDEDAEVTSVEAAVRFVEETGVDSLAVAIGSAHGMYRREPKLDLQRLAEIYANTEIPLVLHGGSGIPRHQIAAALQLGIAKINFDTELRLGFMSGLKDAAEKFPDDPFHAMEHAKAALREVVREKIVFCRP
ncbi:class II fructose-bisphosphate aldolase [Alicyclobacillus mengziensis]|uniref:Class II fructose-bisphosphate aldolase n=1 Tax=Alicyclobacillus mengziensis TaxID=2931921 RepID=A0A9X7W2Q7_9BACL|nr:class II fructose-bisphosphate aldolase [Alicyclobacillus mengziensis]QSO49300.1 class II fructose-bisphosphate aldolase [Alicyclobacillus mengziensis]